MPDFDFDAYNHDNPEENNTDIEGVETGTVNATVQPVVNDTTVQPVVNNTPAQPFTGNEDEVDKW